MGVLLSAMVYIECFDIDASYGMKRQEKAKGRSIRSFHGGKKLLAQNKDL